MMNVVNKLTNFPPYLILILLIVLPWFLGTGYLFFTDMTWGPNMAIPSWTSSWIYLSVLIKGLGLLIPVSLLEKLFIAAAVTLVLFGGRKIAQSLTSDKLILFLCSAFSLFNPFVYDRLMYGQIGTILGYGFFLAFVGYLIDYYLGNGRRNMFLAGVFGGLSILFAYHFVFFVGLLCLVFGVLVLQQEKNWAGLIKLGRNFCLVVLIIVLINFNWLCGVFFGDSNLAYFIKEEIIEQDLEAFKTRGRNSLEVLENVFLMSGFWGIEQFRYEPLQNFKANWGRSFYFLLPIIILGLAYNFKNKEKRRLTIGLIFVYAAAFVLALGIALPITSKITLWFFNNIPFYKGFREPQKWVAVLVAVYDVLLVSGLVAFSRKNIIIKNKKLIAALMTIIILWQAPLMVWGAAGQVKPTNYPDDWYEVNEFIKSEGLESGGGKCKNKILFLPWHMYMYFKWIGKVVANPSEKFFECPVISGKNMEFGGIFGHSLDKDEREVEKWVFSVGRTNLLQGNKLNIGYIILAKEVDWQNYFWLGNHPNVEFVNATENLMVYKVHPVK